MTLLFAVILPGSAFADPLDPAYITGRIDFTVNDVAQFPPFGEQIINPPYGIPPPPAPNDVYGLSQISALGTPPVSDLFDSSAFGGVPNGTNFDFAGPGAVQYGLRSSPTLGLVPGDHISALSYGFDGTGPLPTQLIFSVDPDALGAPGTTVAGQAATNRAAGGLYVTGTFGPFGQYEGTPVVPPLQNIGNNKQVLAPEDVGLTTGKADLPKVSRPGLFEDDLSDVELQPGLSNGNVYFALDEFSPTVVGFLEFPVSSADILVSSRNDHQFSIFRNHTTLGLTVDDMVDALALSLTGNTALFSLAPDSPTLLLDGLSPADVFITDFMGHFAMYANHDQLGLLSGDNLNALDTAPSAAPMVEPSSMFLILPGLAFLLRFARQNRSTGGEGA